MTTQQTDALRLADWLDGCGGLTSKSAAAELRRQHARITELESQLAQRYDAADMATAAQQLVNADAPLPEPHFGEGRHLGLAFRSDAYSVAQVQSLFASHGEAQATAPADPAGDNFGSAEHWKEKAQYWAAAAHRMRQEALRGGPVDGIVHPKADSVLEDAARWAWLVDKFGETTLPVMLENSLPSSYIADGKVSIDAAVDKARKQGEKQ